MGVSKGKIRMSSNSFPTRGEFLAKTEALEMYLQPDKSIKETLWDINMWQLN